MLGMKCLVYYDIPLFFSSELHIISYDCQERWKNQINRFNRKNPILSKQSDLFEKIMIFFEPWDKVINTPQLSQRTWHDSWHTCHTLCVCAGARWHKDIVQHTQAEPAQTNWHRFKTFITFFFVKKHLKHTNGS